MIMAVEILESCVVTPAEETPKHKIWLSIIDLVQSRTHTPAVYLYRRPSPGSSAAAAAFISPELLKTALSKALVPFYPLAGRLRSDSASGRPEIHCGTSDDDDGVLFVTARADATLDELGNPAPSGELRRTLVLFAGADFLAVFQVTLFRCGGMCLGTAIHHTVCDGRAAGNFMRMWAAMARGDGGGGSEAAAAMSSSSSSLRPCHDRTLLRGRSPPAVRFPHSEYFWRASVSSQTNTPFDAAVLPVSKHQLDALKRVAAGSAAGDDGTKKQAAAAVVSTFSAVVAHVWRCACAAKRLGGAAVTRVYGQWCIRSRLRPPLPDGYFGNAAARTMTPATTEVNDIVSSPLGAVAGMVSGAAARLNDDEYVRSLLDYMELAMGDTDTPGLHLGQWAVSDNDLLVVSWIGVSASDLDFGWGRPSFIGRAHLSQSNLVYLVPSPRGDGALNVTVSMEPRALSRFKELFYKGLNHYTTLLASQMIDGAAQAEQDARVIKLTKL